MKTFFWLDLPLPSRETVTNEGIGDPWAVCQPGDDSHPGAGYRATDIYHDNNHLDSRNPLP